MSTKAQIAQVLAGSPAVFDSQGLQQPAIDPILMAAMAGPSLAQALTGSLKAAPGLLASDAGAIFPEGAAPLADKAAMKELGQIVPDSRFDYLSDLQAMARNAKQIDWPQVLQDKWRLLVNQGGN